MQSANCKKQMERHTRVRRKSVTQSFTRCGAEFLRYCFGLAINYTRAIPIFQFTNSLTALLKIMQKGSAIIITSKGNAKRALPTSRSSRSGSSVRPGGSVGGACICREAASSSCAENCVRKGRRNCLSAASCRSPFLFLAISCTLIAIPENNAKNSAPQSVNYCVTDFRRTPVRLQICSLQFALCSTAFFALFSGLAIELPASRNRTFPPQSRRAARCFRPPTTKSLTFRPKSRILNNAQPGR